LYICFFAIDILVILQQWYLKTLVGKLWILLSEQTAETEVRLDLRLSVNGQRLEQPESYPEVHMEIGYAGYICEGLGFWV